MSPAKQTKKKPDRRPGRPRSARADSAITNATLQLMFRDGFAGLSVEEVASKAGVSKATIYRRFPTKTELVISAVESIILPDMELPDTGSLRGDMLAIARAQGEAIKASGSTALAMPRLASEAAATDRKLHRMLQKRLIEPRVEGLREIVRRGVERGEVRKDVNVEVAADMMAGAFVFRALRTGKGWEGEDDLPEAVAETLLAGIEAP